MHIPAVFSRVRLRAAPTGGRALGIVCESATRGVRVGPDILRRDFLQEVFGDPAGEADHSTDLAGRSALEVAREQAFAQLDRR